MLQINSGKLFTNGPGRTNKLRGVLYSNLMFYDLEDKPLITAAGAILPTDSSGTSRALVYEVTEQLEDGRAEAGVLISHTVQPYIEDFSAVASFVLRATCTPDAELCSRLLGGRGGLSVFTPADKLIRRIFNKEIWLQDADKAALTSFVDNLIALKRKPFLAAMRAIRTYVTGLHRVTDDLELAFTLLVASIESLAQDFDGHQGQWSDYDESKRQRIEEALADADELTTERVREAIIKIEHLALARRFRDFTLNHISRRELRAPGHVGAPGRLDLRDALKQAYNLRSQYVHTLRNLPRLLDVDLQYAETIRSGGVTYLTLEGLARVARAVIMEFVSRQPKIEKEEYDYSSERYGVMQAEVAPQYWIHNADGLTATKGRKWFEGFLAQLADYMLTKEKIANLSAVLPEIEKLLPRAKAEQRRSLLAVYLIYNALVAPQSRSSKYDEIRRKQRTTLEGPSLEALMTYTVWNALPEWDLEEHKSTVDAYFEQRNQKTGLRAPQLFEAASVLALAERYRISDCPEDARALLTFAADNIPNFPALASLEKDFKPHNAIDWHVLLPNAPRSETSEQAES